MARSFNISQSIGANTTVADVIAAQGINAFFGSAATINVYWNCSTAATMTASLTADNGTTAVGLVPAGSTVKTASTAGAVKTNEDMVGQYPIDAGSKLLMSVTNPTGGALVFNALVMVN
jgi:hypothetical protein